MGKQNKIEKEVLKTLEYLDDKDTLETNPYFYTRLEAEINSRMSRKSRKNFWLLGILQPGIVALIILINVFTFISAVSFEEKSEYSRDEYLKSIATEYSLNETTGNYLFTIE